MRPRGPSGFVLTGGIGSGKSTVARALARRGFQVIDADAIGHGLIEPNGPAYEAVAQRWPDVVDGGRINRRALGRVVFGDPAQLQELEALLHPLIRREIEHQIRAAGADAPVVVEVSVPGVLPGGRWTVAVVDASEEVRRSRLIARGMEPGEVDHRMAAQMTREEWLTLGHVVVSNDGTLAQVEGVADELIEKLGLHRGGLTGP